MEDIINKNPNKVIFVSGNKNKVLEVKKLLNNYIVENIDIDLKEYQGTDEEIIKNKVFDAYKIIKKPLFVEDTSLYFECLNNLPGPYIKEFIINLSLDKIYKIANLDNSGKAKAVCLIGFIDNNLNFHIFKGECIGNIVMPRKKSGFGWDPIFKPKGCNMVFSEMNINEKNNISHRKKAFDLFKLFLDSYFK
jgi:inosine triphosphate pyrophosphatase